AFHLTAGLACARSASGECERSAAEGGMRGSVTSIPNAVRGPMDMQQGAHVWYGRGSPCTPRPLRQALRTNDGCSVTPRNRGYRATTQNLCNKKWRGLWQEPS